MKFMSPSAKVLTATLPFVASLTAVTLLASSAASAGEAPPPSPVKKAKNWTPPATKIYAQTLSDEIMAKHPELISVTFHGVPPGLNKVYTMFAGSFPERIGNSDDPDDIDVITKGITIVDPRWKRNDPVKKFVVLMPREMRRAETLACWSSPIRIRRTAARPRRTFSSRPWRCAMPYKSRFRAMRASSNRPGRSCSPTLPRRS